MKPSQILEIQIQDRGIKKKQKWLTFCAHVCEKPVGINHEAVCCDKYNKWVHIRCNNICKKMSQERSNTMVL